MNVISIGSHSGGVGRTTAVAYISSSFAKKGYKVLAIDFTSQPNLQSRFGISFDYLSKNNIDLVLCQKLKIEDVVYKTNFGFDFIGCTWGLSRLLDKFNQSHVITALRDVVHPIMKNYDYIFIDLPSRPSNVDFCGLYASDTVFIPLRYGHLTTSIGMESVIKSIKILENDYGIELKNLGAFILNYSKDSFDNRMIKESIEWAIDNNVKIIYPKIKSVNYSEDSRSELFKGYLRLAQNINDYIKKMNIKDEAFLECGCTK